MDDLISRQAAIDALDGEIEITGRTNAEAVKGYVRLVKDRLERLPSADRPQGEWINKGDYAECSNCGADSGTQFDGVEPIPLTTKFCPNCGAKMKGAEDE